MKRIASVFISAGLILAMSAGCVSVSLDNGEQAGQTDQGTGGFNLNGLSGIVGQTSQISAEATANVYGTGSAAQKEYNVDTFNSVIVNGDVTISYYSGNSGKVTAETQENLLPYVSVSTKNHTLTIDLLGAVWKNNPGPKIIVYTPELLSLTVNGAAKFAQSDTIKGREFSINVYGACGGDITLDVDLFESVLAGAGSITYHGKASSIIARIAGAGNLNGLDLNTKDADITISGAGSGSISCSDNLRVTIDGFVTV